MTLGFLRVLWGPRGGETSCGSGGFPGKEWGAARTCLPRAAWCRWPGCNVRVGGVYPVVPQLPQPSRFPTSEPLGSSCLPSRGLCKAEVCFSAAGSWKLPCVLWDWPGDVQGLTAPDMGVKSFQVQTGYPQGLGTGCNPGPPQGTQRTLWDPAGYTQLVTRGWLHTAQLVPWCGRNPAGQLVQSRLAWGP